MHVLPKLEVMLRRCVVTVFANPIAAHTARGGVRCEASIRRFSTRRFDVCVSCFRVRREIVADTTAECSQCATFRHNARLSSLLDYLFIGGGMLGTCALCVVSYLASST